MVDKSSLYKIWGRNEEINKLLINQHTSTEDNDYSEPDEEASIIIDNGSYQIKAGFGGDDLPRSVFPTVVGRQRHMGVMVGMGKRDAYVGHEALKRRGFERMCQPIEYGTIHNWDDMEKIWHHTFYNELRVAPEEHHLFVADKIPSYQSPKVNREKMTQIMFETFNVPAFYVMNQSQLALYSLPKTNGIVIDCGYQTTYSIPVYNGKIMDKYVNFTDIGGKIVSDYLDHILDINYEKELNKLTICNREDTKWNIKYEYCYVSGSNWNDLYHIKAEKLIVGYLRNKTNFIPTMVSGNFIINIPMDVINICYEYYDGINYKLPDGKEIILSEYERTQCIECMFNPKLLKDIDIEKKHIGKIGIDMLCYNTIKALNNEEKEIKNELYSNIIVIGGNSMFNGMESRLKKEVNKLILSQNDNNINDAYELNIIIPENREYIAWIGASIMSQLSSFQEMWIGKDDYDENGPTIVHKKCV